MTCFCGKQANATRRQARAQLRRMKAKGGSVAGLHVYRCTQTPVYHIGHSNSHARAYWRAA